MPVYGYVYSTRIYAYSLIAKEKRRAGVSPGCASLCSCTAALGRVVLLAGEDAGEPVHSRSRGSDRGLTGLAGRRGSRGREPAVHRAAHALHSGGGDVHGHHHSADHHEDLDGAESAAGVVVLGHLTNSGD